MEQPKQYKFEVKGVDKPIIIYSYSQKVAREKLVEVLNMMLGNSNEAPVVLSQTVEELVVGFSKRVYNGKNFIWTEKGWKELEK